MISYKPLWETMKKKGISQYQFINKYHVSVGQLSRMRANQNVSTNILVVLCEIIDCEIQDIACIIKRKKMRAVKGIR